MKRLQMILVGASIFAVSAFGVNQCAILIHKAGAAHLIQNTQGAWNRSITETGDELNSMGKDWEKLSRDGASGWAPLRTWLTDRVANPFTWHDGHNPNQ